MAHAASEHRSSLVNASRMNEVTRELIAGTVGGCCGIIVGQPLDTVKVRMQARGQLYKSTWDCFGMTLRNEGAYGLFRGLTSPLVGNAPLNAILFTAQGSTVRALGEFFGRDASLANGRAPLSHVIAAGHVAGLLQCAVVTPTELVKCQLQVQFQPRSHGSSRFRGPLDCMRQRVAALGVARGLFQGMASTVARDTPSFGLYFGLYELCKRAMEDAGMGQGSTMASFMAGGLAGVTGWAIIYPIDAIKSVVQSAPMDSSPQELRMATVARTMYGRHGWRWFFRGLDSAMWRAFPVNAVTFVVYEWSKRALAE